MIPIVYAKSGDDEDDEKKMSGSTTSTSTTTKADVKSKLAAREKYNFIADVVEIVTPSLVQIGIRTSTPYGYIMDAASGSGFIVSENGLIMTNAHVVRNHMTDICVKLNDGRSFNGRVVKIDRSADLAIIKIDCVRD